MSTRIAYEANADTFPFDKLRVGRRNDNQTTFSDFGQAHQKTYIETTPGIWEEYDIQFDNLQGQSLSYYLAPKGDPRNPFLYWHPILFPKWSQKDAKTGGVSKTKNEGGIKVERFLIKFVDTLKARLAEMSPLDRAFIMGDDRAEGPVEKYIDPIAQHSKFEKTHKTKPNQFNYDKSPGFAVTVWTQDETKRNNASGKSSKNSDKTMKIPNTNSLVYTSFYLAPVEDAESAATANGKKKARKQLKEAKAQKKKALTDYQQVKPFVYRPEGHENASSVNRNVVAQIRVLGPSILWKPAESPAGKVQFKAAEMIFGAWQDLSHTRELSDERLDNHANATKAAMEEFGFTHQVSKKRDRDEPESTDESDDSDNDDKTAGDDEGGEEGEGMQFEGHQSDGEEGGSTPQKKKHKATHTNDPGDNPTDNDDNQSS